MIQRMKKTLGILLAASIGMQVLCSMPVFAEEQIEEVDAGAEELVSDAWIGVEASLMDDTILLQADPEQASGFYLNLSTIALTYYAELSVGNELEATALWKDTLDYDKDGWVTIADATALLTISAEVAVGNITVELPIQAPTTMPVTTDSSETETTTTFVSAETTIPVSVPTETTPTSLETTVPVVTTPAPVSQTTTERTTTTVTTTTVPAVTTTAATTTTGVTLPSDVVARGIDVSMYQSYVNWDKVKKEGNVDFAIIRAGYGKYASQEDPYFDINMQNARAAGIDCGAYWFSYALTPEDAVLEAKAFLSVIKGYQFEYPVVFDMEYEKQAKLSREQASAIAEAFCSTMEKEGYYVSVYSYVSFLNDMFTDTVFEKYDVWAAHFNVSKPSFTRSYYGMWQYSSTSRVPGIDGNVDADYAYRDFPYLMKQFSLNGYTQ